MIRVNILRREIAKARKEDARGELPRVRFGADVVAKFLESESPEQRMADDLSAIRRAIEDREPIRVVCPCCTEDIGFTSPDELLTSTITAGCEFASFCCHVCQSMWKVSARFDCVRNLDAD